MRLGRGSKEGVRGGCLFLRLVSLISFSLLCVILLFIRVVYRYVVERNIINFYHDYHSQSFFPSLA